MPATERERAGSPDGNLRASATPRLALGADKGRGKKAALTATSGMGRAVSGRGGNFLLAQPNPTYPPPQLAQRTCKKKKKNSPKEKWSSARRPPALVQCRQQNTAPLRARDRAQRAEPASRAAADEGHGRHRCRARDAGPTTPDVLASLSSRVGTSTTLVWIHRAWCVENRNGSTLQTSHTTARRYHPGTPRGSRSLLRSVRAADKQRRG